MCPSTLLLAMVGRCCPNEKVRVWHTAAVRHARGAGAAVAGCMCGIDSRLHRACLSPCAAMLSLSFKRSYFSALCWMAKFASL